MDFLVPKLSATMEGAKVLRWLKQVGDTVAMGEPLVEIETDKAAMEVESPVDAILESVVAEAGAELPIGGVLAHLKTGGDSARAGGSAVVEILARPSEIPTAASAVTRPAQPASLSRILASPLARRLADIHRVDLASLRGTGPQQRIRKRDVLAAADARGGKPAAVAPTRSPTSPPAGVEALSAMRSQIAQAVTLSRQTIPSFVLGRWVETTAIDRARTLLGPEIEQATGMKPTFTDFLIQALADSFAAHPHILDRWEEEDGRPGRIEAATVDIGLVVGLPDGMMIPVLRDLKGKTLGTITEARRAAVQRARSGRLLQADYAPVAFSLSNIGNGGADRFEAIINPGQSSILAVGRQHERVLARAGAIAIARGVNLTLSADHRLIDGLHGAEFLETLADRIEQGPWGLG